MKFGYNVDDILATTAKLATPYGIFVTEQDELYICDYGNNCIRKVFNGMITTVVAHLKNKEMINPTSVFVSKSNEIYIWPIFMVKQKNKIKKVNGKEKIVKKDCWNRISWV